MIKKTPLKSANKGPAVVSPVKETAPTEALTLQDLKVHHRTAVEELNRAAVHVVDAIQLAIVRMRNAGDPDKRDLSQMAILRKDLDKVFVDIADLSPVKTKGD